MANPHPPGSAATPPLEAGCTTTIANMVKASRNLTAMRSLKLPTQQLVRAVGLIISTENSALHNNRDFVEKNRPEKAVEEVPICLASVDGNGAYQHPPKANFHCPKAVTIAQNSGLVVGQANWFARPWEGMTHQEKAALKDLLPWPSICAVIWMEANHWQRGFTPAWNEARVFMVECQTTLTGCDATILTHQQTMQAHQQTIQNHEGIIQTHQATMQTHQRTIRDRDTAMVALNNTIRECDVTIKALNSSKRKWIRHVQVDLQPCLQHLNDMGVILPPTPRG